MLFSGPPTPHFLPERSPEDVRALTISGSSLPAESVFSIASCRSEEGTQTPKKGVQEKGCVGDRTQG